MAHLDEYRRKRDFRRTPEPAGNTGSHPTGTAASVKPSESSPTGRFVVHKHAAQRLHYDLRLEQDGVLKSWAVPKGPSLEPGEKRLAVQVEDHPLEYGSFEGVIPEGEYGGGTVMLWDRGSWTRLGRSSDDRIDFVLEGSKLRGSWTLVRMTGSSSEDGKNWLLIRRTGDGTADETSRDDAARAEFEHSVVTGRTMKQIARDRDATWTSQGQDEPGAEARDEARGEALGEASRGSPGETNGKGSGSSPPEPDVLQGARPGALPSSTEPQLATLWPEAPDGEEWIHEIKFDGYRILALIGVDGEEGRRVQLLSRNGKDWTDRFPQIASTLAGLPCEEALLDGEVVALTADGSSSFRKLQESLSESRTAHLVYQVFDLLHLDGHDLTGAALLDRKWTLASLLEQTETGGGGNVRYTDHLEGKGPAFLEQVCSLGLEGIISKRPDAPYRSGRGKAWLKVKCSRHDEFLVGGFTKPAGSRIGFGALLLGAFDESGNLVYAGKVGTGFSDRQLVQLHSRLLELEEDRSPFLDSPRERGVHWVRPTLVVGVEFTEWTRDGSLRHPTFRGLREDREPEEIMLQKDTAAKPAQGLKGKKSAGRRVQRSSTKGGDAEVSGVRLSSPDKVLFPDQGVTKLALARFYEEIAEWILPQIENRPLSLVRCPQGREKKCFFQKHPAAAMGKGVARIEIEESDGPAPYLYVRTLADVISLVQAGVLELHVWGSRVADVERPDILVFDLDPGPDVSWSDMSRIARELRERLQGQGLESFLRTTGGKGLHLVVPLEPRAEWDEAKAFAKSVAEAHAQDESTRVTTNMSKAKRRGKIFLDYLRNGRGATAIASYSTRAREGATVAVPVRWSELNSALRPDRYNIGNLRRRLSALRGDPWEGFEAARRPLEPKGGR